MKIKDSPKEATIRFLDTEPQQLLFVRWYTIYIPEANYDDIMFFDEDWRDTYGKQYANLSEEVMQWCAELPNPERPLCLHTNDDGLPLYYIRLMDEINAVHFKLRWIG